MREAHVRDGKQCVPRLHRLNPNSSGSDECVTSDNLLDDVHGTACVRSPTVREALSQHGALAYARASDTRLGRLYWRRRDFSGQARLVVIKQTAVFDDVSRNRIETFGEFFQRDLFPASDSFNQSKVSRSQQPNILRVL